MSYGLALDLLPVVFYKVSCLLQIVLFVQCSIAPHLINMSLSQTIKSHLKYSDFLQHADLKLYVAFRKI